MPTNTSASGTLYGPLTDALRRLIDAGIRTAVDEDTVARRRRPSKRSPPQLEREQRMPTSTLRHAATGRPLAWANPAVGLRNAIAPPLVIIHGNDGAVLE